MLKIKFKAILMNKYFAKKTVVDNIEFASKKEARRYSELKLLHLANEISDLTVQPKFLLQEKFKKNGIHYRAIKYIGDFMYKNKDGKYIVEDVKSKITKTDVYMIKKKLFEKRYSDLTIVEVF